VSQLWYCGFTHLTPHSADSSSPTSAPHDTKESTKPKAKKARHARNKSSVTSLKQVDKEVQEAHPTKKRQSSRGLGC
jgi:hypothetical protein